MNCHGLLEGMVGKEGRLVLVGHLDVVVGRLRIVEDKESLGMDMEKLLVDREGFEMELEDMGRHEQVDSFGFEVDSH